MVTLTKDEFLEKYPYNKGMPEYRHAKLIYLPDKEQFSDYLGVEYENGELWIYSPTDERKVNSMFDIKRYLQKKHMTASVS